MFVQRVQEVCSGGTLAAASTVIYNQRALSVLSYVAKFVEPPKELGLAALAHRSIHSILRLPPNCMFRNLTNSISFCTLIDHIPIAIYCSAVRFRFAASEAQCLLELRKNICDLLGELLPLSGLAGHLPQGNILTVFVSCNSWSML